ncbi:hypothetical protein PoB_005494400 [Plakobranchus ocellatus]|uniref:Transmembrane protein n=1 Tax=Plakobranchus ocellatus TaxID=259542 RepID=A0AAV4CCJ5_9GAST|nr:hypothetical protein PoB_005494400 [Plakobranchus ocellatus]
MIISSPSFPPANKNISAPERKEFINSKKPPVVVHKLARGRVRYSILASVCLPAVFPLACLTVCDSICLFVYLSVCLSVYVKSTHPNGLKLFYFSRVSALDFLPELFLEWPHLATGVSGSRTQERKIWEEGRKERRKKE